MNSLNHLANDWPKRLAYSDDPYNLLWRELSHFAGRDAAARAMQLAPDSAQFDNFRRAIKLADKFWLNFEEADETVDAVPLYYGALWLGMACAYASLGPDRLTNIERAHGLSLDIGQPPDAFLNWKIGVSRTGAFSRVNEAFGGRDVREQIRVRELFAALPELADDLQKVGQQSGTILASPPAYMGYDLEQATFPNNLCVVGITAQFPVNVGSLRDNVAASEYLVGRGLQYDAQSGRASWNGTRDRFSEVAQVCIDTPLGFFFLPKIRGNAIPEFSIYLMILYALSVVVRYDPNTWLQMADNQTDEYFVVRSFMLHAKDKVPHLVLNHLTRQSWESHSRD